jgi:hypothetical protein
MIFYEHLVGERCKRSLSLSLCFRQESIATMTMSIKALNYVLQQSTSSSYYIAPVMRKISTTKQTKTRHTKVWNGHIFFSPMAEKEVYTYELEEEKCKQFIGNANKSKHCKIKMTYLYQSVCVRVCKNEATKQ